MHIPVDIEIPPEYQSLANHLTGAFLQAAEGKGKERHANEDAFEDQIICSINRLLGSIDGARYQAIKKIIESERLLRLKGKEAAIAELYGSINYLAAACVLIEEMEE